RLGGGLELPARRVDGAGGQVRVEAGRGGLDHLTQALQDHRGQRRVEAERLEVARGAARLEFQELQRAPHLEGGERLLRIGLQYTVEVAGEDARQVGAGVEEGRDHLHGALVVP